TNPKKYRSAINVKLEHKIYKCAENNNNKKHIEIAARFNEKDPTLHIDHSTITKILK
ncbi:19431_t:CDS:1, partial [Funneliformis geosporum]